MSILYVSKFADGKTNALVCEPLKIKYRCANIPNISDYYCIGIYNYSRHICKLNVLCKNGVSNEIILSHNESYIVQNEITGVQVHSFGWIYGLYTELT